MKKWVEGTNIVPKMKKTQVQLAKKAHVHFAFDPFSNGIVGPWAGHPKIGVGVITRYHVRVSTVNK